MCDQQSLRKGIKHNKCMFFCRDVFTLCDVIKKWARRYFHHVMSSKLGTSFFDTVSRVASHCVNFTILLSLFAKTEEFVVFMLVYNKKTSLL